MRKQKRVLGKRSLGVLSEKTEEKKQENREWINGHHVSSKMIGVLLGRQTTPGGVFSALYPLYVKSNLYAKTSTGNRKTRCCPMWWRQRQKCCRVLGTEMEGGAPPGTCGDGHLQRSLFQPLWWFLPIRLCSCTVFYHTNSGWNGQKEI